MVRCNSDCGEVRRPERHSMRLLDVPSVAESAERQSASAVRVGVHSDPYGAIEFAHDATTSHREQSIGKVVNPAADWEHHPVGTSPGAGKRSVGGVRECVSVFQLCVSLKTTGYAFKRAGVLLSASFTRGSEPRVMALNRC
jgi:hypothetical protein